MGWKKHLAYGIGYGLGMLIAIGFGMLVIFLVFG